LILRKELIEDVSSEETPPDIDISGIEKALRYLGRQTHGVLVEIIEHGLDEPSAPAGLALAPLTRQLESAARWTAKERALALWALIEEAVRDRGLGPAVHSRERHAVTAALRLPLEGIPADSWGASLGSRFKQLRAFPTVFGDPTTTQPMEAAWSSGVKVLATHLGRRFETLRSLEDWEPYRPHDNPAFDLEKWINEHDDQATKEHLKLRRPSDHAQKVFAELIVVTVHMKGRTVHRRVTERLVTSRDPYGDVAYFTALGYRVGDHIGRTDVPVRGVWGCREEIVEPRHHGHAPVTRLWFPEPLKYGEQAYFASEEVLEPSDDADDEKYWVDVEVDHHGIARGRLLYAQKLPIRGLTIRIRFDNTFLPEAVWWYAELTENGRYVQPPPGDRHILPLIGNAVQHTFTEHVCQPREHYGIAFCWPMPNASAAR
jgi:hypothetical protein